MVNFTLPICQDLLQKHNESIYRLEYMSTNYGNLPLNSTVTRKEVIFIIQLPGQVHDFYLSEILIFCVEFWELSFLTPALSQAEKKITVVTS